MQLAVRRIRLPDDVEAVLAIDTSFATSEVYRVVAAESGFTLELRSVPALVKTLPVGAWEAEELWDSAWVAEVDGVVRGFAATSHEAWHRRLTIRHFYVDAAVRRLGIGRLLLETALSHGYGQGALSAWLEVTSANVPAIDAYQRFGFRLCGLDQSLYLHTSAAGETALFMARPVD